MQATTTGFAPTLARSLVMPALLFAVVAGSLVLGSVHGADAVSGRSAATSGGQPATVWRASYSRRFPGCVAPVLWPRTEVPRALLVRDRTGAISVMSLHAAVLAYRSPGRADDVRTVGVCR